MGVSRPTAYRWWRRYQDAGPAGLVDRSSRPHTSPARTKQRVERKICNLCKRSEQGPVRIIARLGVPAWTAHAVLVRHQLHRLGMAGPAHRATDPPLGP
jgi:transposase